MIQSHQSEFDEAFEDMLVMATENGADIVTRTMAAKYIRDKTTPYHDGGMSPADIDRAIRKKLAPVRPGGDNQVRINPGDSNSRERLYSISGRDEMLHANIDTLRAEYLRSVWMFAPPKEMPSALGGKPADRGSNPSL